MPEFTITRRIAAPIDKAWDLLNGLGDTQRWNPGFAGSSLTSDGSVADGGTELTLHCSYSLNRLGRPAQGTTDEQLRRGFGGLADALQHERERLSEKAQRSENDHDQSYESSNTSSTVLPNALAIRNARLRDGT